MIWPFPCAFLTGAPGPGEWVLLFLAILLLFGPRRLPEIARILGRLLDEMRRASNEFRSQVMQIDDLPTVDISPEVTEVPVTEEDGETTGNEETTDADSSG